MDPEVIRRVREIQIRAGRQVADILAGHYVSVFRGRGVEFDEVRPYSPGDEIRSIDWNVTARTGQPYVKRYVEERQLTLLLAADISLSQEFGSGQRSKRETAAELCALLALSAIQNDDKVGLLLFDDQLRHFIPPRKGQRHALRVIRDVLSTHDEGRSISPVNIARPKAVAGNSLSSPSAQRPILHAGGTSLAIALQHLRRVLHRRSVCFLISDFWDEPPAYLDALRAARRKHDVIAVLVTDPREMQLPKGGLIQVIDPETRQIAWLDSSSARVRQAFASRAQQRFDELRAHFRSAQIDFMHVDTARSVVDPLVRFFNMRERRVRHR